MNNITENALHLLKFSNVTVDISGLFYIHTMHTLHIGIQLNSLIYSDKEQGAYELYYAKRFTSLRLYEKNIFLNIAIHCVTH